MAHKVLITTKILPKSKFLGALDPKARDLIIIYRVLKEACAENKE